jgi:hypothetical protein
MINAEATHAAVTSRLRIVTVGRSATSRFPARELVMIVIAPSLSLIS